MIIKKTMEVSVDTNIARKMLAVAGYFDAYEKSDEELFGMAINMNHIYGVSYEEKPDRAQEAIELLTGKHIGSERQKLIDEVEQESNN